LSDACPQVLSQQDSHALEGRHLTTLNKLAGFQSRNGIDHFFAACSIAK
jgi:hypothetical protein